MGYPFDKKAYKVMDLENHKFHVSKDVVFHEEIFPFAAATEKQHKPLFQTTSQPSIEEEFCHIHDQTSVAPLVPHQVAQPEPSRPGREHKRPSYLQDYVCCSTASKDTKFCCSTLTSLCVSSSNALIQIAAHQSIKFKNLVAMLKQPVTLDGRLSWKKTSQPYLTIILGR